MLTWFPIETICILNQLESISKQIKRYLHIQDQKIKSNQNQLNPTALIALKSKRILQRYEGNLRFRRTLHIYPWFLSFISAKADFASIDPTFTQFPKLEALTVAGGEYSAGKIWTCLHAFSDNATVPRGTPVLFMVVGATTVICALCINMSSTKVGSLAPTTSSAVICRERGPR